MNSLMLNAILAVAGDTGYPVCTVIENPPGVFPEVTCYDTRQVDGWRFCSDKEASPPGGLFVNYDNTFKFEGYRNNCGPTSCPGDYEVNGRAHRKEVARNDQGVAVATGLIFLPSIGFFDDFEKMDRFNTSSCSFSRIIHP